MIDARIMTLSRYCRQRYGCAVGKVALDLGHICPNRQTGGCIFCRADAFSPGYMTGSVGVEEQIAAAKRDLRRTKYKKYYLYFQQETCTAVALDTLLGYILRFIESPDCVGVILSTRPDAIEDRLLKRLSPVIANSGKECLFELGLQSQHERSLTLLNRNHSLADFVDAVMRIRAYPQFSIAAHLLFGIPQEDREMMLDTVRFVIAQGVDALKLHHLQVLYETPLYEMYLRGDVPLFTVASYFDLLAEVLPLIPPHVVIHRLWATSHPAVLAAPRWNITATRLRALLNAELVERGIRQGMAVTA